MPTPTQPKPHAQSLYFTATRIGDNVDTRGKETDPERKARLAVQEIGSTVGMHPSVLRAQEEHAKQTRKKRREESKAAQMEVAKYTTRRAGEKE